jgi:hypothetical protein
MQETMSSPWFCKRSNAWTTTGYVGVYIYFCRVNVSVMVFNATFNNISVKYVAVSFICRGNWSTWRKRQTSCKSLTNLILDYHRGVMQKCRSRRGRDRMVVGLTTTCAISVYHL